MVLWSSIQPVVFGLRLKNIFLSWHWFQADGWQGVQVGGRRKFYHGIGANYLIFCQDFGARVSDFLSWYCGEADGWQCAQVGGRRCLSSLHSQEDKRPETGGRESKRSRRIRRKNKKKKGKRERWVFSIVRRTRGRRQGEEGGGRARGAGG